MTYRTTISVIEDDPFDERLEWRTWTLEEYSAAVVKAARYQHGIRPAEEPIVQLGFHTGQPPGRVAVAIRSTRRAEA